MFLPFVAIGYIAWHLWCLLPLAGVWKIIIIVLGVLCFSLLFLSIGRKLDSLPLGLASCAYEVGTSSIIVLLYLVITFLLLDIGRLVRLVPREWLYGNWTTTGVLAALLVGIFVYGNLHYKNKVRESLELKTEKPLQRQYKMVMLSDLHIGYHNRRAELARWVDMINEEQADLVLIAGDIIDGSMRPLIEERMAEEFRRLKAPVYACLGNHEYYSGDSAAVRFYQEAGIHLLRDSVAMVGDLAIIGRDDRSNVRRAPLSSPVGDTIAGGLMSHVPPSGDDRGAFTIVLDHQPFHLDRTAAAGVDFQFSGHTHHGQVWPISWITEAIYECAFGEYQLNHTRFYVSSGLGIWGGKFRIGTRSEYVVAVVKPSGSKNIK